MTDIWAQHPGFNLALDGLAVYHSWVTCVVMPIVFQWIEENKAEVYARVSKPLHDDVGAVVRAAFDIVKGMDAYKNGRKEFAEFQSAMAAGKWDAKRINPTWSKISKNLRKEMRRALDPRKHAKAKR